MSDTALPASDEALTEREKRLVDRLFSDPTLFPAPMKTWLVSYLEASDMALPISSIVGLSDRLPAPVTNRFQLDAGSSLTVLNSTGDVIFRIDENGDLHGKTGKSLTLDL